jgi:hypothetical protein
MTEEQARTARIVIEVASVAVTIWYLDCMLDGKMLGPIRPRVRWAWRSAVAAVGSFLEGPAVVEEAEHQCRYYGPLFAAAWDKIREERDGQL